MKIPKETRIHLLERQREKMDLHDRRETEKREFLSEIERMLGRTVSDFDDLTIEELCQLEKICLDALGREPT